MTSLRGRWRLRSTNSFARPGNLGASAINRRWKARTSGRSAKSKSLLAMTDFTIDVRDLRKSFGARKVVDGLTLELGRGEICGFLGANGSGKTPTIRMLFGLLVPDGGRGNCLVCFFIV